MVTTRWLNLVIEARTRAELNDYRTWEAFEQDMMSTGWNKALVYMEDA